MKRYHMPAEWKPQSAVWLTWPDNVETWPDNRAAAQIEFTAFAKSLSEFVTVYVMVNERSLGVAKRNLTPSDAFPIHLIDIPTNDAWARDYAPTFVLDEGRQLVAIDWDYNAWGGKYPPYDHDQQVAKRIAEGQKIPRIQPGLCFEGGAIETNGAGIVLSTISCAIDPNRNGSIEESMRLATFESAFETYLGAKHTVWIPGDAVEGDDTDGHIDQLARFVNESTIVYAWCENESDPQHAALKANLESLKSGLAAIGENFEFKPLAIPKPIEAFGRRVPASYCNFLIANDLVVVPQFGVEEDAAAMATLKSCFPEHHLIGLPSRNLSVGLGSFHCLSQHVPAGEIG